MRNKVSVGLCWLFLLASALPGWAGPPKVSRAGDVYTVRGNGADLSEVLVALFSNRTVIFTPAAPAIKVDRTFQGSLEEVKRAIERGYDVKSVGTGKNVSVSRLAQQQQPAGFGLEKSGGKLKLVIHKAKLSDVLARLQPELTGVELKPGNAANLELKDVTVEKEPSDPAAFLRAFDNEAKEIIVMRDLSSNSQTWLFAKVPTQAARPRVWAVKNLQLPHIAGDFKEGLESKVGSEVEVVVKAINSLIEAKKPVAVAAGHQIVLKGTPEEMDQAEFFLATEFDLPLPQVHLDVWTVQMSTDVSSTEEMQERLGRINQGYRLVSKLLFRTNTHMTSYLRELEQTDATRTHHTAYALALLRRNLLKEAGYDIKTDRTLTSTDFMVLSSVYVPSPKLFKTFIIDNLIADIDVMLEGLKTEPGDREERLRELLLSVRERLSTPRPFPALRELYGVDSGGGDIPGMGMGLFLATYLDLTRPEWRDDFPPDQLQRLALHSNGLPSSSRALVRRQLEADTELYKAIYSTQADLEDLYYEPLLQWVHEEVRDVQELSVVGRSRVAVDSRGLANLGAEAISFRSRTPVLQKEQSDLEKVIFAPDPAQAAAQILLKPEPPPFFSHLAPGISLGVIPTISGFGNEAHLDIRLSLATGADEPDVLQEKGLKPPSLVKSANLSTAAVVIGYDILQLSTIGLTDTVRGDPWGIPILQDIPLIGPLLFRYQGRPERKHKEILMYVQATLFPRCMDLVR